MLPAFLDVGEHRRDIGIRHRFRSTGAGCGASNYGSNHVGNRTDSFGALSYTLLMPQYFFRIQQDGHSSDYADGLQFPDKQAARNEAAAVCADMMRGIVGDAAGRPDWRLDVTDEAGKLLFRFSFVAEAFD